MTIGVDAFLRGCKLSDLEELHAFWRSDRTTPADRGAMESAVRAAMVDPQTVASRLKLLPSKVLDVVQLSLSQRGFVLIPARIAPAALPMAPEEFESAVRLLVQRGFLTIPRGGAAVHGAVSYVVPQELAETAADSMREEARKVDTVFTLHGYLASLAPSEVRRRAEPFLDGSADAAPPLLARRLAARPLVEARIAGIPDVDLRQLVTRVVCEFGGVLARSHFVHIAPDALVWDRRRFREILERSLLGTAVHVSLEEYGINLMEDVVVVFGELVGPMLLEHQVSDTSFDRVVTAGVNFLSDLSSFLAFIDSSDVRITQKNALYKTATRKFVAGLVSKTEGVLSQEDLFGFLVRMAQHLELVRVSAQKRLFITEDAKTWEAVPLYEKLRRAFGQSLVDPLDGERDFHQLGLRKQFASVLSTLEVDRWYDPMCVPFLARNRYLSELDRNGTKTRYQSAFQHTGGAPSCDPAKMSWNLFQFTLRRLLPLGMVDLGMRGDRVAAVRLNLLGATVLGLSLPKESDAERKPLIVNPDFEVLLFAEKRDYNLVYQLDKFCTRIKTDNIYHYRLTREAVSQAVVGGMTADEMLRTLSENARNRLPQNVEFSIRDWASSVRFVTVRRAFLVEADSPETIDRILALPSIKPLVKLRVSDTVLALRDRPDNPAAVQELRNVGVYLR